MRASSDKSMLGLELLRFLSAVAVIIWHYQHFFMVGPALDASFSRSIQPLYPLISFFYNQGHHAVEMFWLISGYIFFWKYHEAVHEGRVGGWAFFVMRFSRLYPLHVATLVLVGLLQIVYRSTHGGGDFVYVGNDWSHFGLHLLFASDWGFVTGLSFNGPIWSVSREVVIYAAFFIVSRFVLTGAIGRAVLVGLAVGLWLANDRYLGIQTLRVFLTVSVYFFAGGLAHAVAEKVPAWVLKYAAPPAAILAVLIVTFVFQQGDATPKGATLAATGLTLVAFLGLEHWSWARGVLEKTAPLGDLTYSSYLIHFPIQVLAATVVDALGASRDVFLNPAAFLAFLAVVFLLGRVVFDRFERPAQALLRRLMLAPGRKPALASR